MKLYLLRHGHSLSAHASGLKNDFDRFLSDQGKDAVRRMVKFLVERGGSPKKILHSPFTRAVQTANEAANLIAPAPSLESFIPLANEMAGEDLLKELTPRLGETEETLAIGHQPQLGELGLLLIKQTIGLTPGGIIAIEITKDGESKLLWSCNPEELPG